MKKYSRALVLFTIIVGALALALVLASAVMTRINPLGFRTALTLFRYGVYLAVGAGILSLAAAALAGSAHWKKGLVPSLVVLLVAGVIVVRANQFKAKALALPLIHDITTDTENPPLFQAIVPLRAGTAANPLAYEGARVADQQHLAYPEIQPLVLETPRRQAFDLALKVVRDLGWKIIHHSEADGRIEATDTTVFFGFKDDIVIRLTDLSNKTRLDLRSLSRVGLSDVGANAGRIKSFLDRAKREMGRSDQQGPKE